MGEEAGWQQTQSELLKEWLKLAGAQSPGGTADFLSYWRDALHGEAKASATGPWSGFQLFARTLTAYSKILKDSRKQAGDVTAAVTQMLEDLIAAIDVALKSRAALGETAWPEPVAWPAFGLTREWQKLATNVTRAVHEEREAAQSLQYLQWTALRDGARRMQASFTRREGPSITSLKGLYDYLIDNLEAAFQEQLQTEAYAKAFGEHVNAGLRLRDAMQAAMRKSLPLLGMPSMAEIESLAHRLAALEESLGLAPRQAVKPEPVPETDAAPAAKEEPSPALAPKRSTVPRANPPTAAPATSARRAGSRTPAKSTTVSAGGRRGKVAAKPGKATPVIPKGDDQPPTEGSKATPRASKAQGRPASKVVASPQIAKAVPRHAQAAGDAKPSTGPALPPQRSAPARAKVPQSFDIGSIQADRRKKS